MTGYALTPIAKADVFNIWRHIAEDNEAAAPNVLEDNILNGIAHER